VAAFIVFEGPEGGGKTSQAKALASWLDARGYPTLLTREPGGTELGNQIRQILLPTSTVAITARTETLLYSAARAQLVTEVIRPALEQNQVVVSDRFGHSTLAYQGFGRGLEVATVAAVVEFATGGLKPDLCILMDLEPGLGLERKRGAFLAGGVEEWNRFEEEELSFHRKVRNGYLRMVENDPSAWLVLDASLPFQTLHDRITRAVSILLDRERSYGGRRSKGRGS